MNSNYICEYHNESLIIKILSHRPHLIFRNHHSIRDSYAKLLRIVNIWTAQNTQISCPIENNKNCMIDPHAQILTTVHQTIFVVDQSVLRLSVSRQHIIH